MVSMQIRQQNSSYNIVIVEEIHDELGRVKGGRYKKQEVGLSSFFLLTLTAYYESPCHRVVTEKINYRFDGFSQ